MICTLLLAGLALPDVLTVDSVHGPYFEIADAVGVAMEGDVLRVAPGSYGPFTVDGVGVTIVPTGGPMSVRVLGPVRIRNISAAQSVSVSGLRVRSSVGSTDSVISLANCDGPIRIQDSRTRPSSAARAFFAINAADVALVNVVLSDELPLELSFSSALTALVHSTAAFHGVRGFGRNAFQGGQGEAVVSLDSSSLYLADCTFRGGDGGEAHYTGSLTATCIVDPGAAGPGVRLWNASQVEALGCAISNGYSGIDWLFLCSSPQPVGPFEPYGSSTVTEHAGAAIRLNCPGSVPIGGTLQLSVAAAPSDFLIWPQAHGLSCRRIPPPWACSCWTAHPDCCAA